MSLLQVYEQMINQIEEETGSLPDNLPRGVAPEDIITDKVRWIGS